MTDGSIIPLPLKTRPEASLPAPIFESADISDYVIESRAGDALHRTHLAFPVSNNRFKLIIRLRLHIRRTQVTHMNIKHLFYGRIWRTICAMTGTTGPIVD